MALIHIYDEMEAQMPYGFWNVTDGEQTAIIDMTNRSVRESFEKPFIENLAKLKETIEHNGWGYLSVKTTDNYLEKLMSYVREGSI